MDLRIKNHNGMNVQNKLDNNNGLLDKTEHTMTCDCAPQNDILIVDDNIFNIITLQAISEYQANMSIDKAFNG